MAPSGSEPVSENLQSSMSRRRARATMPIFEPLTELGIERGAVEEAQVVKLLEEPAIEGRDREALSSEETLDAVGDASSVGLESEEFAM